MGGSRRGWGLWIAGLLMLPVVLTAVGIQPNRIETGADIETPAVDPDRFLDRAWYREVDMFVEDRFAGRGMGLWARGAVDYDLFGDAWSPLVAAGDEGFLFHRPSVEVPCDALAAVAPPSVPAEVGDATTLLFTTGKEAFYGDLLADHDRPDACVAAERAAARDRFRAEPTFLDVDAVLAAAAEENEKEPVFFPRDTHWSARGRVLVAEALIERLEPGLWDPAAVVREPVPELADLATFLGRTGGMTEGPVVRRPDIEVVILDEIVDGSGLINGQHSQATGGPVIEGRTLLIGDSQMAHTIPTLRSYFADLEFYFWLRFDLGGPLPDPRPFDRVIVQSVEVAAADRFGESLDELIRAAGSG